MSEHDVQIIIEHFDSKVDILVEAMQAMREVMVTKEELQVVKEDVVVIKRVLTATNKDVRMLLDERNGGWKPSWHSDD